MPRKGVRRIKADEQRDEDQPIKADEQRVEDQPIKADEQRDEDQPRPSGRQCFQDFVDAVCARARQLGAHGPDLLERFMNLRPPSFTGDLDREDAKYWVRQIEKIFLVMECPEGYKVRFATFLLRGIADYWWRSAKPLYFNEVALEDISWEAFVRAFYEKFFPLYVQRKKEREFLDLVQGNMSVMEYEKIFLELERFAPHICADEKMRATKFVDGLRDNLRYIVAPFLPETVPHAVSVAGIVEDNQEQVMSRKKKRKVQDNVYALTGFDAHVSKTIEGDSMDELDLPRGDKLLLRGLEFHGYHGVRPHEKELGQKLLVDVDVWLDLYEAGETDSLSHTVSYREIYRIVEEVVEGSSLNLLESLAHWIASAILAKYPQISAVRLQVKKPNVAVHGRRMDYLGVEILRYQHIDEGVGICL